MDGASQSDELSRSLSPQRLSSRLHDRSIKAKVLRKYLTPIGNGQRREIVSSQWATPT